MVPLRTLVFLSHVTPLPLTPAHLCDPAVSSHAADLWSIGAVLAELAAGSPLFPATDDASLAALMDAVLGTPPDGLFAVDPTRVAPADAMLLEDLYG